MSYYKRKKGQQLTRWSDDIDSFLKHELYQHIAWERLCEGFCPKYLDLTYIYFFDFVKIEQNANKGLLIDLLID